MKTNRIIIIAAFAFVSMAATAQKKSDANYTNNKVNLMFGLNQPMLGGFNIEGNFFTRNMVFDYSHGAGLTMKNEYLDENNKNQGIDVHLPWTTGFGVGFRFNDWLNLRAEPKWHRFELYYAGEERISQNRIGAYTTFTMGLGLYANIQPWKKKDNFLKGIMVAPSIRYWPRVSSTLNNDELTYFNQKTESFETHKAMQVGIGNTPIIFNVSVGYSFGWDGKKSK